MNWSAELKMGGGKRASKCHVAFNWGAYGWGAFDCIFWGLLSGALLSGALLSGALFSGALLSGALLSGVLLSGKRHILFIKMPDIAKTDPVTLRRNKF